METKIKIIDRYIELKRQEKDVQKSIEDLKPLFFEAAETLALENRSSQIEMSGAILFRCKMKVFEYPQAIQALQARLKAKKALYESRNEPKEVKSFWSVKF